MRAAQFTRRFEIVDIEDVNVFTSRILIGASVCVVASVEYDEVALAARIRMSTRIILFIPEMGRCSRAMQNENEMIKICFVSCSI